MDENFLLVDSVLTNEYFYRIYHKNDEQYDYFKICMQSIDDTGIYKENAWICKQKRHGLNTMKELLEKIKIF